MAHSFATGSTALSFTFSTQQLRVVLINGEPWFVAADVCAALEVKDPSMACSRLDDDERGTSTVGTPSGEQQMLVINESGLYSLVLTSRKPEAKRFKKWVTSEVLPSIRKTGQYTAPVAVPPETTRERLNERDLMALRRVVWLIAGWFHLERSWSAAVYKHLRAALGHPSPTPWYVDQLPAIRTEIASLVGQTMAARQVAAELEAECMRGIFKKGVVGQVNAQGLLEQFTLRLHTQLADTRHQLPAWLATDLEVLTDRTLQPRLMRNTYDEQPEVV